MTDQERLEAFMKEYQTLTRRYGIEWGAGIDHEQQGVLLLVRPALRLQAVAGWTPPAVEPKQVETAQ